MPSTSGHGQYDTALLADAQITRQQLQEGYTTDLLQQPVRQKIEPQRDPEAVILAPHAQDAFPTKPLPFWRTKKGIIIISIASIVVLAAVIGGAVGGSKKGKGGKTFEGPTSADSQGAAGAQSAALSGVSIFGGISSAATTTQPTQPTGPAEQNQDPGVPGAGGVQSLAQGASPVTTRGNIAHPTPM
ncbi:hypothetical protein BDN72DRAFT_128602 [Pluteus cervinus]|uniref:Uncharacterized protein n=1 Tax=Pluteus cervinus TaxID=181527 RepID=A0ACD3ANP0_9AGAR|nr:hypothetical protein BDN72DRAFT_128602 [Pluteus cervinus]